MKRLEHLSCEKRLRELGLSRMGKALWRELINVYKRLKRECNEDRLFSVVPSAMTRGNGPRFQTHKHKRFPLNTSSQWGWPSSATSYPERFAVSILGVTQKPSGHGSGQLALGIPDCFPQNLPAMITIIANFCALFYKKMVHKDVGIYSGDWPDMSRERRQVRILEQELLPADDFSLVNEWQSGRRRPNTSKRWGYKQSLVKVWVLIFVKKEEYFWITMSPNTLLVISFYPVLFHMVLDIECPVWTLLYAVRYSNNLPKKRALD